MTALERSAMRTDDFNFELPPELIAQHPAAPRRPDRRVGNTRVSFTTSRSPDRSRSGRSRTVLSCKVSPTTNSRAASRGAAGCWAISSGGSV